MKNLFYSLAVLIALGVLSCAHEKGFVINGKVTGFQDSTKIYIKNRTTQEIVDSSYVIKDKFILKGFLSNEPEELFLSAKLPDPFIYMSLIMGNESITIEGDISDFPRNLKISGSKIQDDNNRMNELTKRFDMRNDSLIKAFFNMPAPLQTEKNEEFYSIRRSLSDTIETLRLAFTKGNINTYPALIHLVNIKTSLPKDTLQILYSKLTPELKSSKYGKVLHVFLDGKICEVGDKFYDFEAFNRLGTKEKLSDIKGKYILLDFTAANCGPCVHSAKVLRKIDKTYSDSLSIVSFSCDANKEIWLKSLDRDSVSWISLWDEKGPYSDTYIRYGVSVYPSFFLIDPKGVIIDSWLGFAEGYLEDKLKRFEN